jgi:uncharacterized membrane protein
MNLVSALIYSIGGVICHQLPARSFFWDGHQFPVCARCTGLYLSGAVALVVWMGVKVARGRRPLTIDPRVALRVIVIAALPTVATFAAAVSGIWDGSNMLRAVLAIPLGAAAGVIVGAVFTKNLR